MKFYDKQMDFEKKYNSSNSQPCLSMFSCMLFIIIIYMLFFQPPSYIFLKKQTFFSTCNHASVARHLVGIYRSQYYMTYQALIQ